MPAVTMALAAVLPRVGASAALAEVVERPPPSVPLIVVSLRIAVSGEVDEVIASLAIEARAWDNDRATALFSAASCARGSRRTHTRQQRAA